MNGGRRAIVDVGIGYATSGAVWMFVSALGLTTLLQATGWCDQIALVGGIMICVGGVLMVALSLRFGPRLPAADTALEPRSRTRTVLAAMMFHGFSPGTVVLYLAAAPVLVTQACGPTSPPIAQTLLLGGSVALILFAVNAGYARLFDQLRRFLETRRNRQLLEIAMGTALTCSGLSLAL